MFKWISCGSRTPEKRKRQSKNSDCLLYFKTENKISFLMRQDSLSVDLRQMSAA